MKHQSRALVEQDNVICMNNRYQCPLIEIDGWEVVWIVEFVSAIVGRFIH